MNKNIFLSNYPSTSFANAHSRSGTAEVVPIALGKNAPHHERIKKALSDRDIRIFICQALGRVHDKNGHF